MLKGGGKKTGAERRREKRSAESEAAAEPLAEVDPVAESRAAADPVAESRAAADPVAESRAAADPVAESTAEILPAESEFTPRDITDLEADLYRRNQKDFDKRIKRLRDYYIQLWNNYNGLATYDVIMNNPIIPRKPLTEHQKLMRLQYNTLFNYRSEEKIKKSLKTRDTLFIPGNSDEDNYVILDRFLMFVYSIDSINRHVYNTYYHDKIEFKVSPNSFEIHCNTIKKEHFRKDINPLRFFGHVTLILTRDLTKKQTDKIMSYPNDHHKSDAQKHFSEVYHYGIEHDHGGIILEKWWRTLYNLPPSEDKNARKLKEEYMINLKFPELDHFPTDTIGVLMKKYYLHCINTCPINIVHPGHTGSGFSRLTFKDFTNWGTPKRLV
jgi:hypothetical protein